MTTGDPWSREIPRYLMESPVWYADLYPAQAKWIRDFRARVRCTAHRSTDGQPCRNYAMRGCLVCHAHGGRARQVRLAAMRRLDEAATDVLAARACRRLGIAV